MSEVTMIGVDLAKRVFQVHGPARMDRLHFKRSYLAPSCYSSWRNSRNAVSLTGNSVLKRCPLAPPWHGSSPTPNVCGGVQRGSSLATGAFTGEASKEPSVIIGALEGKFLIDLQPFWQRVRGHALRC